VALGAVERVGGLHTEHPAKGRGKSGVALLASACCDQARSEDNGESIGGCSGWGRCAGFVVLLIGSGLFMEQHPFGNTVTTMARLRELVPQPSALVVKKVIHRVDEHVRALIGLSPYVVIATADADGVCDSSPRGGEAGFVKVLDEHHVLIPEVTGNRRADSLSNVLVNGSIGMVFLIPGFGESLRVNGRAVVVEDEAVLERCAVKGKRPVVGIGVSVQECYVHCAKASMRAGLWEAGQWAAVEGRVGYRAGVLEESDTKRLY
jgi:PPOX class probable FMN-dependent enzyme